MGYSVTNSDRLAMIEILNYAWHVKFSASREKGSTFTRWDIQAVNPVDKAYYTVDGFSMTEAIENYFQKMEEVNGKPPEREVWTSLWDAKLDLVKEDEE